MGLVANQSIHPSAEQELAEIVEFVTRHTRTPGLPWNVADEYPHVFQAKNLSFMKRLYSESGELIAHALWWPLLLQTPRLNWKLALIGSVATHPEHRRKGYSREVIGQCLSEATRQSCDLAVLWSDQSEFYTRLGFSPCGYEELFLVDRPLRTDSILLAGEREIRVGPSVDPAAILRLYQWHTIRAVRSLGDMKKFLHIPGSQVWTSWSKKDGQLLAYAVIGKGADFPQVIHEWGGMLPDLLDLVERLRQAQPEGMVHWLVGAHSLQLIRVLQEQGCQGWERPLAWVKLLSLSRFEKKLQSLLFPQMASVKPMALRSENSGIRLTWGEEWVFWPSEKDFLSHVLGSPVQAVVFESSAGLSQLLERVLPLEWWVWGWDSI